MYCSYEMITNNLIPLSQISLGKLAKPRQVQSTIRLGLVDLVELTNSQRSPTYRGLMQQSRFYQVGGLVHMKCWGSLHIKKCIIWIVFFKLSVLYMNRNKQKNIDSNSTIKKSLYVELKIKPNYRVLLRNTGTLI